MYNPDNQYRCAFIRGKAQTEIEDLLPFYANLVHEVCPCTKDFFDKSVNDALSKHLFSVDNFDDLPKNNKKTVSNHRTEMIRTLLGLYVIKEEETGIYFYESESCKYVVERNDLPTFFKNICLHMQFPNGFDSVYKAIEKLEDHLNIKSIVYVVELLLYAAQQPENILLTKQEVGYYALGNLDVLQGKVSVDLVYNKIIQDRNNGVVKPRLSGSNEWQHINEQFNLLLLSNMAETDSEYIWLNPNESKSIAVFLKRAKEIPIFDVYAYDLPNEYEKMRIDWGHFYGTMDKEIVKLQTEFYLPNIDIDYNSATRKRGSVGETTIEIGDKGEALVYKLEVERIKSYKPRWVNKVLLLGKTKGLGYDISSLEANEDDLNPEFARYIEVKTTTRISVPKFDENWKDSIKLTAKEWIAAIQHKDAYNIYRVYFTKTKTIIIRIKNPFEQSKTNGLDVYATEYQMDILKQHIMPQYEIEA